MSDRQPVYRIIKRGSREDCRRTIRYDRSYEYALVGPRDENGIRYVISCSHGPGGHLKRFMEIANEAFEAGYRAGLQHNGGIE